MINAMVTGRLGQDPELKHLQDGTAVLELSIASSSAKREGETTWVRASMFGERGTKLAQYLHKGDRIAVCGTLELRKYDGKNGPGSSLDMRADQVDLIQDKRDGDDDRRPEPQTRNAQANDRNAQRSGGGERRSPW